MLVPAVSEMLRGLADHVPLFLINISVYRFHRYTQPVFSSQPVFFGHHLRSVLSHGCIAADIVTNMLGDTAELRRLIGEEAGGTYLTIAAGLKREQLVIRFLCDKSHPGRRRVRPREFRRSRMHGAFR